MLRSAPRKHLKSGWYLAGGCCLTNNLAQDHYSSRLTKNAFDVFVASHQFSNPAYVSSDKMESRVAGYDAALISSRPYRFFRTA